jgi:hypothetical protein
MRVRRKAAKCGWCAQGLAWGVLGMALLVSGCRTGTGPWWKGNLHTHSLWSDGDDYPEMIVDWYKERGYDFLALSDHNVLLEGERWIDATNNAGGAAGLSRYVARFGESWVEMREVSGRLQVRLKGLEEFRGLFEEKGRFLLVPAEEITDEHESLPVHVNATNLREYVPPQGGASVLEVMQNNVNAVLAQRMATGQPMFPHVNHPNFGWAITAEDLMQVKGERFFEIYNGHPAVRNEGDATRPGTERMWDIVLSWRLGVLGLEPMYGLAVDDAHNYHVESPARSNPGRGWVMVRAKELRASSLIEALEAGEFYASTGVRLRHVGRGAKRYRVEVESEPGVEYTIQFIGTRLGFDREVEKVAGKVERERGSHRYSAEVGAVLAEAQGDSASYRFAGDELYVRARVVSTKTKLNPYRAGEVEMAWTQPHVVASGEMGGPSSEVGGHGGGSGGGESRGDDEGGDEGRR